MGQKYLANQGSSTTRPRIHFIEEVGDVKTTKYRFNHFIISDGQKKEIVPSENVEISAQCKLVWANMATGKEHTLKVAQ